MSDDEIQLQTQLQLQQMQSNLQQSEAELAQARKDVEESRRLIISLGQAFVPSASSTRTATNATAQDASNRPNRLNGTRLRYTRLMQNFYAAWTPISRARFAN